MAVNIHITIIELNALHTKMVICMLTAIMLLLTFVITSSSLMAVNIHITIIELNALHTKMVICMLTAIRLLLTFVISSSSLMAVNIHITIIELNALHTKRQNLFQELDAVIHLLMEAKHWGLR